MGCSCPTPAGRKAETIKLANRAFTASAEKYPVGLVPSNPNKPTKCLNLVTDKD